MSEKCKICGCKCTYCTKDGQHSDMHLHVEIENLRQSLVERDNHIVTMETQFLNDADKFPNGELASIKEEILIWQDKYSRLFEAHKRVQKVNQSLEDKLLRIVDKCETEKGAFTKDIATLSHRLADANYTIHRLTQDNEKYRSDVNLAVQLLQCKPSNFVGQKYDSLPSEVQAKVRTYIPQKRRGSDANTSDVKSITVPISTFPPTAMVYNVSKPSTEKFSDDDSSEEKPPVEFVSAAIMAKVLEDREKERIFSKHCDTCTCHRSILMVDAETQTTNQDNRTRGSGNCDEILIDVERSTQICQSLTTYPVYHVTNENMVNNLQYNNGNCSSKPGQFPSAKDKLSGRNNRNLENCKDENFKVNANKKGLGRRYDLSNRAYQDQIESADRLVYVNNNDESLVSINDKIKLDRLGRKDKQGLKDYESSLIGKTPIDIINDRLWKNEWAKSKLGSNFKDRNRKKIGDLDVINSRDWKNDKLSLDSRSPIINLDSLSSDLNLDNSNPMLRSDNRNPGVTLIEVRSADASQNEMAQMDVTTSPSFSSDSVVISTSDPSSSSSDVIQSIAERKPIISNSKSTNRVTGPRNCLMRLTPGKNILLDNVGTYQTVLYTTGNKPCTALVHAKKSFRAGVARSISTSSDENSPVLLQDNNQLQRVAEWVQSSVMDNPTRPEVAKSIETPKSKQRSSLNYNSVQKEPVIDKKSPFVIGSSYQVAEISSPRQPNSTEVAGKSLEVLREISMTENAQEKDLITFDTPTEGEEEEEEEEEEEDDDDDDEEEEEEGEECDIKITKEMEETYLKLAASLDPAALNLPSQTADLTIEKYRKDHKKLHTQRIQDRLGSTT
ncbi:general transcription factor 3C polypeptide 5 [Prorops nasuta]|uniref:general transcription factor 3C polypeptide 5 n=1 Tax=Prorops nasuta TaxID=863751 RepID=UPI0034CFE337